MERRTGHAIAHTNGTKWPKSNVAISAEGQDRMGVALMLTGALEAVSAGWIRSPWYSVFLGVLIATVGFAVFQPTVIYMQAKRGGLPVLLALLAAVLTMAGGVLYAVGRIGAALFN